MLALTAILIGWASSALYSQPRTLEYLEVAPLAYVDSAAEPIAPSKPALANTYTSLPAFSTTAGYKGLDHYLKKSINYPEVARLRGEAGIVKVRFVILPSGKIENIKVMDAPSDALAVEAVRMVEAMPLWTPATKANMPVKSTYQINIDFNLR